MRPPVDGGAEPGPYPVEAIADVVTDDPDATASVSCESKTDQLSEGKCEYINTYSLDRKEEEFTASDGAPGYRCSRFVTPDVPFGHVKVSATCTPR